MMKNKDLPVVKMIPLKRISVINPRERNKKIFRQIVDSISKVGLKRPITVCKAEYTDGEANFELVCGQGRLEAFFYLGQHEIPAIVIEVTEEERLIMSLVENQARRQHRPLELLQDVGELKKRSYSDNDIAKKIGLSYKYVHSIVQLLQDGEERLLVAVETGQIPLNVAMDIAETDFEGAQEALAQAYKNGLLRGKKLLTAKRVIEQRQRRGKAHRPVSSQNTRSRISSAALVRAYRHEADRQNLMIKKAEITQNRLLFIVEGMRALLKDENFVTLLRAEGLSTMPRPLADLVQTRGEG
ncbi:MAG: ParB/RepB/Spo0J family partition protein [Proteobacteria bacterium]|jgi:ParB family chromosome partitioning protein|nr:ParB/RepB/Spo0J family partition protein [Alphaproteobacteria bacterium]MBT4404248.1 ParB/RepB/Spo0J family partition protein [Acidiferrobacteraceae bacterium]MBT4988398.1 ParB/RepB/Spo0J family partition protein [Pseudomonadota bacterium]